MVQDSSLVFVKQSDRQVCKNKSRMKSDSKLKFSLLTGEVESSYIK